MRSPGSTLQQALGFWDPRNALLHTPNLSVWDPTDEWHWHPFRSGAPDCVVDDLLSQAMRAPGKAASIVLVGDSLDRSIVTYLCALPLAKSLGFRRRELVHKGQALTCDNGRFSVTNFNLYGLVIPLSRSKWSGMSRASRTPVGRV